MKQVEPLSPSGTLNIKSRTKSHLYVTRTAQTSRQAIDGTLAGGGCEVRIPISAVSSGNGLLARYF